MLSASTTMGSDSVDKNGTVNTGTCPSKKCADSANEPAKKGLNRLETENSEIDVTSTVSGGCNEMQDMSEHTFFAQMAGAGLVTESFHTENTRTKHDSAPSLGKDFTKVSDIPKDLGLVRK